jgi:hypothetical protein
MNKFNKNIYELNQFFCANCCELWPSVVNYCVQCRKDKILFSQANDMIPNIDKLPFEIQHAFEKLTMIEEILIAPVLAIMSIYRLPNGILKQRGFVANFSHNVNEITQVILIIISE